MKLKHLESALESVVRFSDLGTDKVNIDLEQYRYEMRVTFCLPFQVMKTLWNRHLAMLQIITVACEALTDC